MKITHKHFFLLMLFLSVLYSQFSIAQTGYQFYISTKGSSLNNGSKKLPFLSLQDAKRTLEQLKKKCKNKLPEGGVTFWLRKGIYELPATFLLTEKESGNKNAPVIFSAFPGEEVFISGGKRISAKNIGVLNGDVSKRVVQKSIIGEIKEIDLGKLEITDYGINQVTGFRRPYVNAAMELFVNGKPYHLARYPNRKMIRLEVEDVIDKGIKSDNEFYPGSIRFNKQKLADWKNAADLVVSGNFKNAWATDQLRIKKKDEITGVINFADSHQWGIYGGHEWNQYYFFNLMEEIDEPGEYFIDRQQGKLYFYPLENIKDSDTIQVSMLEDALITLKGVSYIQFNNITFETGRGIGIYMENTVQNKIMNCTIRNMGVLAVCIGKGSKPSPVYRHPDALKPFYPNEKLSGRLGSLYDLLYENTTFNRDAGKENGIINCRIENMGCGGISLGGGDRLLMEPAGNYVYNTEFTNCARIDYSYKCPVNIDGVGNKIQHCRFNECPATAIYIHGNNHLIEYNSISESCKFMDDQGAIYIGRDPSEFGNIIRYNFFKNIGKLGTTIAVYYDDGACGTQLYGNVFYKAGKITVLIGGGSFNPVYNNIFIESDIAINLDDRLNHWANYVLTPGSLFDVRLKSVNYKQPPFSKAYPELADYFNHQPQIPQHNNIYNNFFINVKQLSAGQKEWGPVHDENLLMDTDPGFLDSANLDFELKKDAAVFKKLPGFKSIPFRQIGLTRN